MSDPSAPPSSPYPRAVKKAPRSVESKFIGYLVLGFGILAVVAVLLLAFMNRGPDLDVSQPDAKKTEEVTTSMEKLIQAPPPVAPKPEKTLFFKRQPDFDPAGMQGNWQTMIGMYTAVLQMNQGVYQVILAADDPLIPRFYSSGQYTVLEDMITFNPRNDWPRPASKNQSANYQRITRAPYAMIAAFYEGKMLWQNIPPDEERARRLVNSPLFMSENVDYVVWQKLP